MILINKKAEDLIINDFFYYLFRHKKRLAEKKSTRALGRPVPLITMNPQSIKKTIRKDKDKISR